MPKRLYIPYKDAEHLLQEGDVLLFRTKGFISNWIKAEGEGEYSHVAITSESDGLWEAVEFREWYGGRAVNLRNYIELSQKDGTEIDVFRCIPEIANIVFDEKTQSTSLNKITFNPRAVTRCMRELTALPYSYKRIWLILKIKLFKWHMIWDMDKITNDIPSNEIIYPVCSTVLAHCFAINNFILLKNRSDQYIEPSHIALTPRLNYLFTPCIPN